MDKAGRERTFRENIAILMKQRDLLLLEVKALSNMIDGLELAMKVLSEPDAAALVTTPSKL